MQRSLPLAPALALALFAASAPAATRQAASQLEPAKAAAQVLQARQLEQVGQDHEAALALYRAVATSGAGEDAAADAVLGAVRCLLALGRNDEATAFPGQVSDQLEAQTATAVATLVRTFATPHAPMVQDAGTAARVEGLIRALGGSDNNSIEHTLRSLGDLAGPYLIAAARQATEPVVVRRAVAILADRVKEAGDGSTAEKFFVELDPMEDPVLLLEALLALRQGTSTLPRTMHPWLDRCARSTLPRIREHCLALMVRRDDEAALAFCRKMLTDPDLEVAEQSMREVLGGRAQPSTSKTLCLEVLSGGRTALAVMVADRTSPHEHPEVWFAAATHPEVEIRRAALRPPQGPPLDQLYSPQQLQALCDAFVSVLESDQIPIRMLEISNTVIQRRVSTTTHGGGADRGLLKELPFQEHHVRRIGSTVARGDLEDRLRIWADSPKRSPLSSASQSLSRTRRTLFEWMAERLDTPVMEEAVRSVLEAESFRRDTEQYEELVKEVCDASARGPRAQLLLEVVDRGDDPVSAFARGQLVRGGGSAARELLRDRFSSAGSRLTFMGASYDGALAQLLFDTKSEHTVQDLCTWLTAGTLSPETLDSLLKFIGASKWSNHDPMVVDAVTQVIATHPSVDVRMRALKAIDDHCEPLEMWNILGQLEIIQPGAGAEDYPKLARELWKRGAPGATNLPARFEELWRQLSPASRQAFGPMLVSQFGDRVADMQRPEEIEAATAFCARILMQTEDPFLRGGAAEALQSLRAPMQDSWLRAMLECGDYSASLVALVSMDDRQSAALRDLVEPLTLSKYDELWTRALDRTAALMDVRAARTLVDCLRSPLSDTREAAMVRLREVRTFLEESARWEQAEDTGALSPLGALLEQSRSPDPAIRELALGALGALGDPKALPALIERLRTAEGAEKAAAQKAIDRLIDGGEDRDA